MLKAMIVEDERATREKLLENVDWRGLRIEPAGEAKDGAEGLKLFGQVRPDIVLLDVRMPRMNGIECAAAIRELDPDCKIIFLSGYTDKEYLKSAIQMQAIDYIEKPIDLGELHAVLKRSAALCEQSLARAAQGALPPSHNIYGGQSRKIRAAIEYIKEHYGDDLTVVAIADRLEMGTTYLSTLFKKETGQALSEYIEAFRMQKAKELLIDGRMKMSDVAESVGYRNANYFASVFKKSVGRYPSEFRREHAR